MLELCIDTSSGASVAVVRDGQVLARARQDNPRRHAEDLAGLIETAAAAADLSLPLAQAGWTRVCVSTGPAPYTGLRAGLVTAEVFARAAQVPLYGVPALAVIARAALDVLPTDKEVLPVTDARRKEVYWARYQAAGPNGLIELAPPQVGPPESLASVLHETAATLVGPGAPLVSERIDAPVGPVEEPDAAVLSRLVTYYLGAGVDLPAAPLYLRRPAVNLPGAN